MRPCPSNATLLASLMVSHTKALPQTNCTTFLSWAAPVAALTCTTSTTILAAGTSLSRSFRGLTWSHSSDGYHWQLHLLFHFQPFKQKRSWLALVSTYIQVVDGQEGLRFGSLLLDEIDTVAGHFLRGHHNGVHVAAKHLGDSQLVLLMDGAAQVRQTTILGQERKTNKWFPQIKWRAFWTSKVVSNGCMIFTNN